MKELELAVDIVDSVRQSANDPDILDDLQGFSIFFNYGNHLMDGDNLMGTNNDMMGLVFYHVMEILNSPSETDA